MRTASARVVRSFCRCVSMTLIVWTMSPQWQTCVSLTLNTNPASPQSSVLDHQESEEEKTATATESQKIFK